VVFGKPRLLQIDGIHCEVPLSGRLVFMKNLDVPGVIGHVGSVLGKNQINIANFSLGREEGAASETQPLQALAVVEVDSPVEEATLAALLEHPAVRRAKLVEFPK
jgi:D-3-phosphoglycerate dehydrogenase